LKLFKNILRKLALAKPSTDQFLNNFFRSDEFKFVVQIGANDGIQNDPIRNYLKKDSNFKATLVEPIPFYVEKLQHLYASSPNINIIHAAAGSSSGLSSLYFIPPELADEMNGDGPDNNWAHGQGSFDLSTVIHWIYANSFRGNSYRNNIQKYIESISKIDVLITPTESILPAERGNLLLVLDVQGFELEVLKGIDLNNPPKFIMLEDDLGNTGELLQFMAEHNFSWIAGDHDKVFEWLPNVKSYSTN
jgi:FkbM family methyltransferase